MIFSPSPLTRLACAMVVACGTGSASVASSEAAPEGAVRQTAKADPKQDEREPGEEAQKTKKPKAKNDEPQGWHRDGFALKKGKSRIELAGYVQEDFRRYDWDVQGDETGTLQAPERELRRLRIGAKARFSDLSLELVADPRTSEKGSRLKDATIGYEFSKKLSVLVGHFKPPVSAEVLTSGAKTDFMDRSMIASRLGPDRDWGAQASGELGRLEYALGVFQGDGDSNSATAGTSGAGRASLELAKDLHLSGSFMYGEVTADPRVGTREPSPKGASGATASGFTFWNRPHVDGKRRRLGGEVAYVKGRFRILGEYLEAREERFGQGSTGQDIPDVRGRGWSAQASYVLIGERKGSTVEPHKSIFQGGAGAIELVARAEALKFDDTGDPSGFAGFGNRARNISPSGASAVQAGVNYWASNFLKVQGSALWESYNDGLIAPVPGNKGRYLTLLLRAQVMVP